MSMGGGDHLTIVHNVTKGTIMRYHVAKYGKLNKTCKTAFHLPINGMCAVWCCASRSMSSENIGEEILPT